MNVAMEVWYLSHYIAGYFLLDEHGKKYKLILKYSFYIKLFIFYIFYMYLASFKVSGVVLYELSGAFHIQVNKLQ